MCVWKERIRGEAPPCKPSWARSTDTSPPSPSGVCTLSAACPARCLCFSRMRKVATPSWLRRRNSTHLQVGVGRALQQLAAAQKLDAPARRGGGR